MADFLKLAAVFSAAVKRAMAAFSGSLNFGYALANSNKNMVGSCGEGYLMMNLLLGYSSWKSGANRKFANCFQTSSTACL